MDTTSLAAKFKDLATWNKVNTYRDEHGVQRVKFIDKEVPSPSRLMQMLNLWIYGAIDKPVVLTSIRNANVDVVKMMQEWKLVDDIDNASAEELYDKMTSDQRRNVFLHKYGSQGNLVHEVISTRFHNPNDVFVITDKVVNQKLNAFRMWQDEHPNWKFVASELFVYNQDNNTKGIIDGIFFDDQGQLWVVDFKTNREVNIDYVAIQLFFYRQALASWDICTDNLAVLHLTTTGYHWLPVDPAKFALYERIWQSLINIYEFKNYLS